MLPYEVGIVKRMFVKGDKSREKGPNIKVPEGIELWFESDLFRDVTEPIILDYMVLGEIEFPFSPPVPRPMDEYTFVPPRSDMESTGCN